MRKTLFTHGQVYNLDQVKKLNELIKKNLINTAMDKPAQQSAVSYTHLTLPTILLV